MISAKPFLFGEHIRRIIFRDRPAFFNVKDLNKEFLVVHNFIEEFNKAFGVTSDLVFNFTSFVDAANVNTGVNTRTISVNWGAGYVLYKGARFTIGANAIAGFSQAYPTPSQLTDPKQVAPPTYIVLTATLNTVDFGANPAIAGLQSTVAPFSVPSVDVEQYKDLTVSLTDNPAGVANLICVLGTLHPKFNDDGTADGWGFIYNVFRNPNIKFKNGVGNADTVFQSNQSLFEYLLERVLVSTDNLLNERQLVRRFGLADLVDTADARQNLGLAQLVNATQLIRDETFRDIPADKKALARQNLELKKSATMPIGLTNTSVARGDVIFPGLIAMYSGAVNTIPANWALCNGQTKNLIVTPDLSGKFVVGYKAATPDYGNPGNLGGVNEIALAKANLPNITLEIHDELGGDLKYGPQAPGTQSKTNVRTDVTNGYGNVGYKTEPLGAAEPLNNRPEYYVVAFIMFVGYDVPTVEPAAIIQAAANYPMSVPDAASDGGYADYVPTTVGSGSGVTLGAGISLTNPE